MLFIQMIGRDDGLERISPKVTPLGIAFYINPYMPVFLKNPGKHSIVLLMADHAPVRIVEWIILKHIFISQTIILDYSRNNSINS